MRHRLPDEFLLTVGTIEPRKNHMGMLRALEHLGGGAPPLVVAGARGWLDEKIVASLRAAESRGIARYLGAVSEPDLMGLYRASRVLVYPSLYEGFGLPPMEAMALGVPVVTSDRPALTEVTAGFAILVDPEDPIAIAKGIERALSSSDAARLRMAQRWAERFTWERCARATRAVYERMTDSPRGKTRRFDRFSKGENPSSRS
jgi:alpha-1,3-rhamnosyl/mannosyltransferase